jgi:hypothetical protein
LTPNKEHSFQQKMKYLASVGDTELWREEKVVESFPESEIQKSSQSVVIQLSRLEKVVDRRVRRHVEVAG